MKRLSFFGTVLLLLVLIFFTLFGGQIYESITPTVEVMAVNSSITKNNVYYLQIPKTALMNDSCVYIVTAEQGFSRMLYTIQKKAVSHMELPDIDVNSVYVSSGITKGDRIISKVDSELLLEDGDRVIVK